MADSLVSDWFFLMQLNDLVYLLKEGDLLEFKRKRYSHWAVYVGYRDIGDDNFEPCVIHRIVPEDLKSWFNIGSKGAGASAPVLLAVDPTTGPIGATFAVAQAAASAVTTAAEEFQEKCCVQLSPLYAVIGKDRVRINNSLDRSWTPLPFEEIITRAERGLQCSKKYNVLHSNCEHFAKECRYGRKQSCQVQSALAMPITFAAKINPFGIPAATAACVALTAFKLLKPILTKRLNS